MEDHYYEYITQTRRELARTTKMIALKMQELNEKEETLARLDKDMEIVDV